MASNPDELTQQQIPGAPGFFFPAGLSPEERDAYLLRLRFGPSLFKSGQNFSSAGGDEMTNDGANPNAGPGVVNPSIVQNFLAAAKTPTAAPKSHSAQMVQRILDATVGSGYTADENATPEQAQPTNEQEWFAVNQPGGYGYTPQQVEDYNLRARAWGGEREQANKEAEQAIRAKAAENKSDVEQSIVDKNQALADRARNPVVGGGRGAINDRVAAALGLKTAQAAPAAAPAAPVAQGAPKPAGRQVTVGEKNLKAGDWIDMGNGKKAIWDGKAWSRA